MATRKRYTKPFKDEACRLVTDQKQEVAAAARRLGVAEQTLRYWLVQRVVTRPRAGGTARGAQDDPRWLKARVRDLEERLRRAEMEQEV